MNKEECLNCEVCGKIFKKNTLTVVSSSLGAMSFRYCMLCYNLGAELDGMQDFSDDYLTFRNDNYVCPNNYSENDKTQIKKINCWISNEDCARPKLTPKEHKLITEYFNNLCPSTTSFENKEYSCKS